MMMKIQKEDMIMVTFLFLNTFDLSQEFITNFEDGLPYFDNGFPYGDSTGFSFIHNDEDTYIIEQSLQDLEEIFYGSLFYGKYSDVSPIWFWDFDEKDLSAEALYAKLLDKFTLSSSITRLDHTFINYAAFTYIRSEVIYLQCFV